LLSEDSYLLEGLQSSDKTETHPKAKSQNATLTETEANTVSWLCTASLFVY